MTTQRKEPTMQIPCERCDGTSETTENARGIDPQDDYQARCQACAGGQQVCDWCPKSSVRLAYLEEDGAGRRFGRPRHAHLAALCTDCLASATRDGLVVLLVPGPAADVRSVAIRALDLAASRPTSPAVERIFLTAEEEILDRLASLRRSRGPAALEMLTPDWRKRNGERVR